jgi:hypothetical protein
MTRSGIRSVGTHVACDAIHASFTSSTPIVPIHDGLLAGAIHYGWVVSKRNRSKEDQMTEQMSETPILDLLATMTAASIDVSGLDEQSLMLVRLAALVAVDAPPASYLLNLGAASEMGIDEGRVRDVLAAVAPIVGTTRIVSATGNIARALGIAIELADLESE